MWNLAARRVAAVSSPRATAMADRSGPRMALILGAALRVRMGQSNDPGRQHKYPNQNQAHGWLLFTL